MPRGGCIVTEQRWTRDFENDFDCFDPEFGEHKDALFPYLAEKCPVSHGKDFGGYVAVNSYEEVRNGLINWEELSSGSDGTLLYPMGDRQRLIPMELDPPEQRVWRQLLNRHFTAEKLVESESQIRDVVREQMAHFSETGSCDLVDDFTA